MTLTLTGADHTGEGFRDMTDTAQPNAEPTQSEHAADRAGGHQAAPEAKFTQDDLNFFIAKEKAEIQRSLQEKYGNFDDLLKAKQELDQQRDAELSELEKLQKQLAAKDAEIAAAKQQAETERLNTLRLRVGQSMGFHPEISALLQGADEDEMKAHAERLKEAGVGGSTQTPSSVSVPNIDAAAGGEQRTRSSVKLTPSQQKAADFAIKRGVFKSYEEYMDSLRDMQGE